MRTDPVRNAPGSAARSCRVALPPGKQPHRSPSPEERTGAVQGSGPECGTVPDSARTAAAAVASVGPGLKSSLYHQIFVVLKAKIQSGELAVGSLLPYRTGRASERRTVSCPEGGPARRELRPVWMAPAWQGFCELLTTGRPRPCIRRLCAACLPRAMMKVRWSWGPTQSNALDALRIHRGVPLRPLRQFAITSHCALPSFQPAVGPVMPRRPADCNSSHRAEARRSSAPCGLRARSRRPWSP